MDSFFFWSKWHKEYRYIWYGAAGIFCVSILFLWFAYFNGEHGVIQWDRLQEQKMLETTMHAFRLGPFEISVPGETYIIFEYLNGSQVQPNTTASYLFLFIITCAAIIILTVFTTIEKFWYFVAMTLFIIFMVSLRLEVLGLFGFVNHIPAAVIIGLYLIPSFYFSRIRKSTPFLIRLAVFFLITTIVALAIYFFATVPVPFYHLTLTSFTASVILSILFIIMVSHEIIAGFVSVISQGNSKSLNHVLIISTIYLVNVLITTLHEIGYIEWNFIYINLYLLLTISALLGLWGFRQRENLYENIVSFYPLGAFFFVAFGAICFATTAQLISNANDPGVKIMRDFIIFSHMGFGLIFLMYLFSNFAGMLAENKAVHKVMYNPNRMPYFTFRLAGLIVMLGFVFNSNWRDYVYNGLSAFYNTAGDMYRLMENDTYAESFYNQARVQGFRNHRSNYILAISNASSYNYELAHKNYFAANAKRPTAFSLTNAGNLYMWKKQYFSAIKTYRAGLARMDAGTLYNNLGLAYIKVHNIDSAAICLHEARSFSLTKNAAETNFFGMAAQEIVPLQADSVLNSFNSKFPGTLCNALALSTIVNKPFDIKVDPLAAKKLDLYTATLLNNYIIKNAKKIDTLFINQAYTIASDPKNEHYSESLKSALAFGYYHQGNIARALEIMAELVYLSQSYQGRFNYIMGLWALEQQNPVLASQFFSFADSYQYKQAPFYYAIALTESGKTKEALAAWDSLLVKGDETQKVIAQRIRKILTATATEAASLNDMEKYQYCRYRIGVRDSILFNKLSNTFDNANYKAQALLDLSKKYLEAGLIKPAVHYYRRIAGLELTDRRLYDDFRHFELVLLAYRGEINTLAQQINKGIEFDSSRRLEKIYYTALITDAGGDTATAAKNYKILARYNPYFEDGVIASYIFHKKAHPAGFIPYSILAEAVQINTQSIKLWKVYHQEALNMGLDEYAANAAETIAILESSKP